MANISKVRKPDSFESHSSLKPIVTSIWGIYNEESNLNQTLLIFLLYVNLSLNQTLLLFLLYVNLSLNQTLLLFLLYVNLSLNQTLLIFLLHVRQTWKTQLILANSLKGFCYLNARSCCLCEGGTSFARDLSFEFKDSHLCLELVLCHLVSSFIIYRSPSSSCTISDAIFI